ncbi:MAG TPA: hypothetical protein VG867_11360, partial [Rhizomicrobium sp.]|nr:hypothetical protein [Rhizomicrobium sp.]
ELETALTHVLRIAVEGTFDAASASPGLKMLLARAGKASDFDALQAKLADLQARVAAIFQKAIG